MTRTLPPETYTATFVAEEEQQRYWCDALSGSLPVLRLNPDHPRPPVSSFLRAVESLDLDQALFQQLRNFSAEQSCSLAVVLLAAYNIVLHRYTGEEDILVGSVASDCIRWSGTKHGEYFTNVLALRTNLAGNPDFQTVLSRTATTVTTARRHRDYPFAKVCESLRTSPAAQSPSIHNMFVLCSADADDTEMSLQEEKLADLEGYTNSCDLALVAVACAENFSLSCHYDAELFEPATIARLLGHYQSVLSAAVSHPEMATSVLPLLTDAERHQLVVDWNATQTTYPPDQCVHQLFEAQVARTPDAIAVVYENQQLTYSELNTRANQLAHYLRSLGVGPEVLVGLCVERSLELVIGLLAVLKAGGAYLPLDPRYPAERLRFMLDDAQVKIVLTQGQLLKDAGGKSENIISSGLFNHSQIKTIFIEDTAEWASTGTTFEVTNLRVNTAPDNVAYVIYTSGSTGKPKGTLVSHYNVVRLFQSTAALFGFNADDTWTLFHSYAFDFSVWEIWGALLYGGKVVVVPYDVSRSPEEFAALIVAQNVTVLNQTPSAFRQLMPHLIAEVTPERLPLRSVIFGGEALELQSLQPWFDRYGDQQPRMINMYGITETTVHVTYRQVLQADLSSGVGSVIGTPIPDLRAYLLDPHQQLVPIGIPGELYVGGAGVARGYLNRPELTAARFIADPFGDTPGARLYRSGDLARRRASGELEYLGRIDHQVKIRGFRIELGEIDAVLSQHPAVQQSIVVLREDSPGDKRLAAYIVAVAGQKVAQSDLQMFLRTRLPDYMVPSVVVFLDALPLNANGKIDRKALPAPDHTRPELKEGFVAPRTPAEETLSRIWSAVLGVKQVGIHDNFFELGGDSILSIQVIARARQVALRFSLRDLFKNPTISELAALCSELPLAQEEQGQVVGSVPLTPIQSWFLEQNLADLNHWNQSFLFETAVDIDVATLEESLRHVVQHHDALRLRFRKDGAGWQQSHAGAVGNLTILRQDLSALPAAEHGQALITAATALQASLNIAEGPIMRAAHFSLGAGRPGRLLLILHHLVVDGVSWRILMEDLESAYVALRDRKTVVLPAKTTAFQTWALRLKEYAQQPALREEFAYWRQLPAPCVTQIPVDVPPRGANSEDSAQTVTVTLSREETRALLQQVPAVYHTQINDVLLTALGRSLGSWIGGESLLVDLEGHGREDIGDNSDTSRTVGWFTTIFPVRLDLRQTVSMEAALGHVKEQLRQIPHRGLGYGALRYLCNDVAVRDALHAHPQAAVAFNYLGQFDQVLADSSLFRFAKESCGPWHSPANTRKHLIEVLSLVSDGRLEVRWTYSQNLHQRKTIGDLADKFVAVLRSFITQSQTSDSERYATSDFPLVLLDQATLSRVLREYNGVEDIYPLSPMQRLFYSMEAANSRVGFEQWHFTFTGPLNVDAFKHAWEQVTRRHSILRSAFLSDGLDEPVQLVLRQVSLTWTEHDWRSHAPDEQQRRIASVLEQDRQRNFNLSQPPLMRLVLIRVTEDAYHLVWSTHHLLIDGWSWPVLFNELSACYDAARRDAVPQLATPCLYRDYIAWLQQRSENESKSFWRTLLAGMTAPTVLALGRPHVKEANAHGLIGEEVGRLSAATTTKLQSLARSHQLTLNTVLQGAWALLLSQYSGTNDVLFGAAFSGRPPEVAGIETMVGPCVNNLPVRVRVDTSDSLVSWLRGLQEQQFEASQHQYSSLSQIQEWSQIPWRHRLFESLLVFQNYVVGDAGQQLGANITTQVLAAPETANYPITLTVIPGPELRLKILYQGEHCGNDSISRVLADLKALLEAFAVAPARSVAEILATLPELTTRAHQRSARLLPAQNGTTSEGRADIVPQTEMERLVAKIWRELFQSEQVSMEENFFDLGGHSLLLVQVHKRLQEAIERSLPIVTLFQYPTIRSLARNLSEGSGQQQQLSDVQQRAKRQQEALARQRKMAKRG